MAGNPAFQNSPAFSSNPQRAAQADVPRAPQGHLQGGAPWAQNGVGQQGYQQPSVDDLNAQFNRPAASPSEMERLTYEGVIFKTVGTLGVVALGFVAGIATFFTAIGTQNTTLFYAALWGGAIVGLVLGLVNSFKREPSPLLIMLYAFAEGIFLGALSAMFEWGFPLPGIIFQALLGTASVFIVTLVLFSFKVVRATPKLNKVFMIALGGYALFSIINFVLMITGINQDPWGMRSIEVFGIPLGLLLGGLAVLLGAYSLVMDFTAIDEGVKRGVHKKYGWSAAFGLTVTIVWLYVEILRIIAIARGNN